MPIISLQLPDEIADPLADIASATDRNESCLVIAALSENLTHEVWITEQIQQALSEADTEDFASNDEIRKIAEKWNANTPEQAARLASSLSRLALSPAQSSDSTSSTLDPHHAAYATPVQT